MKKIMVLLFSLFLTSYSYCQEYEINKKLIWAEEFDSNKNDWGLGENRELKFGKYSIKQSSKSFISTSDFNINHLDFNPNNDFQIEFEFKLHGSDYHSFFYAGFEYRGEYNENAYSKSTDIIEVNGIGEISFDVRCNFEKVSFGKSEKFRVDGINKLTIRHNDNDFFIFINNVLVEKLNCKSSEINTLYNNWFINFGVKNGKVSIYSIKLWKL